jgi:hypothetical protein
VAAGWSVCRRRGEGGKRLAEERYAWPAIALRTLEVYREVLTTNSRGRLSHPRGPVTSA